MMVSRSKTAILSLILVASAITAIQSLTPAYAAVGDTLATIDMEPILPTDSFPNPGACQVGLAFDGAKLYVDECFDTNIYKITTSGVLDSIIDYGTLSGGLEPNAMAYDVSRNGLWIGHQGCDTTGGMPINFLDFDTGVVTTEFTIPAALVNAATGSTFLNFCFIDGLAFNVNNIADPSDDELWISDDIANNAGFSPGGLMRFKTDGTVLASYDPTTVDPAIAANGQSGLAVGGADLYMGDNGGGDVFRAIEGSDPLVKIDQFVATGIRAEDMECDPFTKAPIEGMWVRNSPQAVPADNLIRLFEIEAGTCNPIPPAVGGVVLPTDAMALMGLTILSQPFWLALLAIPAGAAFAAINFRKSHCQ